MMVKIGVIFKFYMPLQQYKLIYLPKAFRWVNYLIALKWHVGYKNDMKMKPIFTIIFISKMLI
jgi:hypothetical protein